MFRLTLPIVLCLGLSALPAQARIDNAFVNKQLLDLPSTLSFAASNVEVHHPSWFATLFDLNCEARLTSNVTANLELETTAPRSVILALNGVISPVFEGAKVSYVPVHYIGGEVVHPYFLVETANWVKFHFEIHKSNGIKTMRLFLLQGRPGSQTLVPILTAQGV